MMLHHSLTSWSFLKLCRQKPEFHYNSLCVFSLNLKVKVDWVVPQYHMRVRFRLHKIVNEMRLQISLGYAVSSIFLTLTFAWGFSRWNAKVLKTRRSALPLQSSRTFDMYSNSVLHRSLIVAYYGSPLLPWFACIFSHMQATRLVAIELL